MKTHQRFAKGQVFELPRHGGVEAKNWRRRVANAAVKKPTDNMRTLSFPLDLNLDHEEHFEDAAKLYDTVEGLGQGSLAYLWMRVHLCGLGLYTSTSAAHVARMSPHFPDRAFVKALEEGLGIVNLPLTPQDLFVLFTSPPNGERAMTPEDLSNRIYTKCFGQKMSDKTDENIRELVGTLANAVCERVSSYKDLAAQAWDALAACGDALQKQSPIFPLLRLKPVEDHLQVSLAFNGLVDAVCAKEPEQYWPHHIVACLLRHIEAKKINDALLSYQDNCLSQLFGVLLSSAKGAPGLLRKTSVEDFCEQFGIPADRKTDVARLMEAANAIPKPALFDEENYSGYRKIFAGKWRSWVSNYLSRLKKLEEQTQKIGPIAWPQQRPPSLESILSGLGLDEAELIHLDQARIQSLGAAKASLAVLMGRSLDKRPIQAAQDLVTDLQAIDDAHATFRSVLNQLDQALEGLKGNEEAEIKAWRDCLDMANSDVFVLPQISGGSPNVTLALAALNKQQQMLFKGMEALLKLIERHSSGCFEAAMAARQVQEKRRAPAARAKNFDDEQFLELARRRFVQSVLQLSKRLSPSSGRQVRAWLEPLVSHSKAPKVKALWNKVVFNQMGSFYRSPWSPAKHEPLPICWSIFHATPWMSRVCELKNVLYQQLHKAPNAELLQDLLEVMRFVGQLHIDGMQAAPADAIKQVLANSEMRVHLRLKLKLDQLQLAPADVASVLTAFASQLARLRFQARRPNFIVRHKFSRVGAEGFVLVPKEKAWRIPPKYLQAKGALGELLQANPEWVEEPQEATSLFKLLARGVKGSGEMALLEQLPHDWYVDLGFRKDAGQPIEGLTVGKKVGANLKSVQGARLRGPSTYLTQISKTLTGRVEAKEWMLILDWVYESTLRFEGGVPVLAARALRCEPRLAVPFNDIVPPKDSVGLFEHMVAIDLGEREIGFAVFSVSDIVQSGQTKPIIDPLTGRPANGAIRIAGVRRLINNVKGYRSNQSTNSKLSQNFNTQLKKLRDSVGSEVVQKIEALCARFSGFPVLESSVVYFQTHSRQLDLVYGDVVRHFVFSGVDAHIKKRQEHWRGADKWTHPYLMVKPYDEKTGKRTGKPVPLNLFPGAEVHPAGTSQRCAQCGRNGLRVLRELANKIQVTEGGFVETPQGKLQVMAGWAYDDQAFKCAKRNKKNLPMNKPLKPGIYSRQDVEGFAKRTNRQKSFDLRSSGSTQSRFQCLFADCLVTYHADAGAAINIGRKFIEDKVDFESSRERFQQARVV